MNISHSTGPQIFHILLSKLGHDINHLKKPKKSYLIQFHYHYLAKPNAHIPFFLKSKTTYAWQYFKSPRFKSMAK